MRFGGTHGIQPTHFLLLIACFASMRPTNRVLGVTEASRAREMEAKGGGVHSPAAAGWSVVETEWKLTETVKLAQLQNRANIMSNKYISGTCIN
jgi:hypothetical protein